MKTVYLVRHGIAADLGELGVDRDEDRMLNAEGRKKTQQVAAALRKLKCAPDRLYSSPLLRARQTAEIIGARLKPPRPVEIGEQLAPGVSVALSVKWLSNQPEDSWMLVGHAPDLPELAAALISRDGTAGVEMKKASVACITFIDHVKPGAGTLAWLLQPAHLRPLGG
jgi:phosphohistidine phosphatase